MLPAGMDIVYTRTDLEALSYRELQALAKTSRLKANGSRLALIVRVTEHYALATADSVVIQDDPTTPIASSSPPKPSTRSSSRKQHSNATAGPSRIPVPRTPATIIEKPEVHPADLTIPVKTPDRTISTQPTPSCSKTQSNLETHTHGGGNYQPHSPSSSVDSSSPEPLFAQPQKSQSTVCTSPPPVEISSSDPYTRSQGASPAPSDHEQAQPVYRRSYLPESQTDDSYGQGWSLTQLLASQPQPQPQPQPESQTDMGGERDDGTRNSGDACEEAEEGLTSSSQRAAADASSVDAIEDTIRMFKTHLEKWNMTMREGDEDELNGVLTRLWTSTRPWSRSDVHLAHSAREASEEREAEELDNGCKRRRRSEPEGSDEEVDVLDVKRRRRV